jgi:tetratricopeptide (TPR) repeat protein
MARVPTSLDPPPLVGRSAEISLFHDIMDRAAEGRAAIVFLAGDGGIGKTRLTRAAAEEAARRDWGRAVGGANPVETGVPYALFADALLPALAGMEDSVRAALTRGADDELAYLFPSLAPRDYRRPVLTGGEVGEFKSRVHWNFTELVKRFTGGQPLCVVLEDLQWADPSSLELLHFIARNVAASPLVLIGTFKPGDLGSNPGLRRMLDSLKSLGACRILDLGPLSADATVELVRTVFDTDARVARTFATQLHRWTGGNPFFIQETLKALVLSDRLYQVGGQWMGWEVDTFELPGSIRDAILRLMQPLDEATRDLAGLASVIGSRIRYDTLSAVTDADEGALISSLEQLQERDILTERAADEITYEFSHALVRETLYAELGRARAQHLHGLVAERLERHYGGRADAHADELAFHYSRARSGRLDRKAARYLAAAGHSAYAKYANGEAATYLAAALERIEADTSPDQTEIVRLTDVLARTRQRLGDYDGALQLWEQVRRAAQEAGDSSRVAATERRTGLACFWMGRPAAAIEHYDAGLAVARGAGDRPIEARLLVAKAMCLHQLGQPDEAIARAQEALTLAEDSGGDLVARVYRALMLLHVWTGPVDVARRHGEEAIRLAAESPDRTLAFSAHWGMGVLEGLSGNAGGLAVQIDRLRELAEEVNSPVRRVWTAELEIEYAAAHGNWDEAIVIGERSIALARSLNQSILIPRLLVWTALIHLAREQFDRAERYIGEAWKRSGADAPDGRPPNLHTVIPAHIGRASMHLARGEYPEAIRVGQAGLTIADRHGRVSSVPVCGPTHNVRAISWDWPGPTRVMHSWPGSRATRRPAPSCSRARPSDWKRFRSSSTRPASGASLRAGSRRSASAMRPRPSFVASTGSSSIWVRRPSCARRGTRCARSECVRQRFPHNPARRD